MSATDSRLSRQVLALVATGLSPVEALRQVCGPAVVDHMLEALWLELKRR
jgi:hypothetical protein